MPRRYGVLACLAALLSGSAFAHAQTAPPPAPERGAPGYGAPYTQRGYGQPYSPPGYGEPYSPPGYGAPYAQPGYGQPYSPPSYGKQPYAQAAPQPARPKEGDDGKASAVFLDLLTLRVQSYDIVGSDADAKTYGFLFAVDPDVVVTDDYVTARSTWFMAIGGGSDGLEGQLESASRAGVRGYFGDDHGPFARAGLGFQFLGNNKIYRSQFDLPALDLGYQLLNEDVLFELAGTGALVLGGRFFLGDDAERRIDTEPALGASVTFQYDPVRVHATAQRIYAGQTGPGTPIDQAQAQLCLEPFTAVILCGHGAYHRGAVELPNGGGFRDAHATYFGVTAGLGVITNGSSSPSFD